VSKLVPDILGPGHIGGLIVTLLSGGVAHSANATRVSTVKKVTLPSEVRQLWIGEP
jgi:hypothetical protein